MKIFIYQFKIGNKWLLGYENWSEDCLLSTKNVNTNCKQLIFYLITSKYHRYEFKDKLIELIHQYFSMNLLNKKLFYCINTYQICNDTKCPHARDYLNQNCIANFFVFSGQKKN
ncbi:hypothetical protein pb186bvf_000455 [Paramecium bursaria]